MKMIKRIFLVTLIILFSILFLAVCRYSERRSMTLQDAISNRDVGMVKVKVKDVPDLNKSIDGMTYLGLCFFSTPFKRDHNPTNTQVTEFKQSTLEMVKILVGHGADVNLPSWEESNTGGTPLFHAIFWDMEEVVEYLLDHGASVEKVNNRNQTSLMYTINFRPKYIQTLLKYGADKNINHQDDEGNTVLHIFLSIGDDPGIVQLLIQNGVDINIINSSGSTAIDIAKKERRIGSLQVLENAQKLLRKPGTVSSKE